MSLCQTTNTRKTWVRLIACLIMALYGSTSLAKFDAKDATPIRLGILSMAPPAKIYKLWSPFADYLAEKVGRPVEIVVPRGFQKIKEAVVNDSVDLFYINSLILYRLKEEGKAIPVAQMYTIDGSIYNRGVLVARVDSNIKSLKDLKGKKLAFISPMASGGYLAQRAKFQSEGIKTKTDAQEVFTKNLTTSLHKVILGDVQAAAMCGINFRLLSQRFGNGELETVGYSETFVENAFGANPKLEKTLREKISSTIIDMINDSEGQRILSAMKNMKIKKFVKYDPGAEKVTRELINKAEF